MIWTENNLIFKYKIVKKEIIFAEEGWPWCINLNWFDFWETEQIVVFKKTIKLEDIQPLNLE